MEEDIKKLEEWIEMHKKLDYYLEEIKIIENLIKTQKETIWKSKIKEKMLSVKIETFETPDDYYIASQILQELMED